MPETLNQRWNLRPQLRPTKRDEVLREASSKARTLASPHLQIRKITRLHKCAGGASFTTAVGTYEYVKKPPMTSRSHVRFDKRRSVVSTRPLSSLAPEEVGTWLRCHRDGPWSLVAAAAEDDDTDGDDFSLIESVDELRAAYGDEIGTLRELNALVAAIAIARVRGVQIYDLQLGAAAQSEFSQLSFMQTLEFTSVEEEGVDALDTDASDDGSSSASMASILSMGGSQMTIASHKSRAKLAGMLGSQVLSGDAVRCVDGKGEHRSGASPRRGSAPPKRQNRLRRVASRTAAGIRGALSSAETTEASWRDYAIALGWIRGAKSNMLAVVKRIAVGPTSRTVSQSLAIWRHGFLAIDANRYVILVTVITFISCESL